MAETRTAQFARIRSEYGAALGRVVRSYARPGADQEDLGQDISLALWNALPAFRGECPERAFVLRVAHNRGLHFLYRRRPTESVGGAGDDAAEAIPDPARSADAALGAKQDADRLYAAIRTLSLPLRQVLTLALEELPHAEIAQALGLSTNNVDVRLSRARAALRTLLNPVVPTKEERHG